MNKLINFVKESHPYSRTIFVISLLALIYLVYFSFKMLPVVDATSIQAGLTLIAELLGVILGALLVVVVFYNDQLRQAEGVLENMHSSYQAIFKQHRRVIISTKNKFMKLVKSGKVALHDRTSEVTSVTFRDVIISLVSLAFYFEASSLDTEQTLVKIGFSSKEVNDIEISGSESILEPHVFFSTLKNALNIYAIQQWVSPSMFNFLIEMTQRLSRDGIIKALGRYEVSKTFLRSRSLTWAISMTILTLFVSIFTIFGVTPNTYRSLYIVLPLYFSLVGFFASVILTSFSIRKMFSVGDNPMADQYHITGS